MQQENERKNSPENHQTNINDLVWRDREKVT